MDRRRARLGGLFRARPRGRRLPGFKGAKEKGEVGARRADAGLAVGLKRKERGGRARSAATAAAAAAAAAARAIPHPLVLSPLSHHAVRRAVVPDLPEQPRPARDLVRLGRAHRREPGARCVELGEPRGPLLRWEPGLGVRVDGEGREEGHRRVGRSRVGPRGGGRRSRQRRRAGWRRLGRWEGSGVLHRQEGGGGGRRGVAGFLP